MSLNFLKIVFVIESFGVLLTGLLIALFEHYLPTGFADYCLYGKLGTNGPSKLKLPKRICFRHFYTFSGPLSTIFLILLLCRCYLNLKTPEAIVELTSFFLDDPIRAKIPVENVLLALIILTIHCWKRFYECHCVNVFSEVHMNVFMYVLGLFYYFGAVISIFGEGQNVPTDAPVDLKWTRLGALEYACFVVSLTSTYLQFRAGLTLSNLRKNKKGVVVTNNYDVPRGGLFEYITAPQQLTEIIFYLCLSLILRFGSTFHYVTMLVLFNQIEHAYFSHKWYLKKFKDYPKSRKIIVPYIF